MERIELSAETLHLEEKAASTGIYKWSSENRRIFYVDVGTSPLEAEKAVDDFVVKYKRKEIADAGYFYCPHIPTLEIKPDLVHENLTNTEMTMSDMIDKAITEEIDKEIQNTLTAASDWSEILGGSSEHLSMQHKLKALGIDNSFLEPNFDSNFMDHFDKTCQELLEDTDTDEMLEAFEKVSRGRIWTENERSLALRMFRAGWEMKEQVSDSSFDHTVTWSIEPSITYYYPNPIKL